MKHWMILLKTPIFIRFKNVGNLSILISRKWRHSLACKFWWNRYEAYWSQGLRYPLLANAMSLKRYEQLRHFLHVVDNDALPDKETDKLAKIWPMIKAIRNQCVNVEPEEYHSVDEQIIPSKTKQSKVCQYNPKKPRKWGFKNLLRAEASRFMYNFYIYGGKEENIGPGYQSLQKCATVVEMLCKDYLNIVTRSCSSTIGSLHFLCFISLQKLGF